MVTPPTHPLWVELCACPIPKQVHGEGGQDNVSQGEPQTHYQVARWADVRHEGAQEAAVRDMALPVLGAWEIGGYCCVAAVGER